MKTALRTQKLAIDIPVPDAEPWINGIIQHVIVDEQDNIHQIVDRSVQVHRRSSDILTDTTTYTDPVTLETVTVSGAGLQVAITQIVSQWIIEDCAAKGITAELNEFGRLVIVE